MGRAANVGRQAWACATLMRSEHGVPQVWGEMGSIARGSASAWSTGSFNVSRTSVRRQVCRSPEATARVDPAFVPSGPPRCVAVSVDPMVPNSGNGSRVLSIRATCAWLQTWGFAIDEETDLPQPDQTVNGANPIPMAGGRSDRMDLLPETVPQPAA